MVSSFVIFHKKSPSGEEIVPQGVPLWSFKTCLRSIHFSFISEGEVIPQHHDYEVYSGREAYAFALTILCGLHSPVVGETEVFGQFKTFWMQIEGDCPLSSIFHSLITDVKKIRQKHLKDLGSQSYGSLVRRFLPESSDVAIVGAGSLVQDILPWIYKDKNEITLYVRNPEKHQALVQKFPRLKIISLQDQIQQSSVIVAAPVTAGWLGKAISNESALVIDLRGESRLDPCLQFDDYKPLADCFATIDRNKENILSAKKKAAQMIEQFSVSRFFAENLHPFGWDDLCAL